MNLLTLSEIFKIVITGHAYVTVCIVKKTWLSHRLGHPAINALSPQLLGYGSLNLIGSDGRNCFENQKPI